MGPVVHGVLIKLSSVHDELSACQCSQMCPFRLPLLFIHFSGDGWSARYEDAALHGCVPVIIMDNTLGPFEALIDYSQFSVRWEPGTRPVTHCSPHRTQ